jgi:hypothetical protein
MITKEFMSAFMPFVLAINFIAFVIALVIEINH